MYIYPHRHFVNRILNQDYFQDSFPNSVINLPMTATVVYLNSVTFCICKYIQIDVHMNIIGVCNM